MKITQIFGQSFTSQKFSKITKIIDQKSLFLTIFDFEMTISSKKMLVYAKINITKQILYSDWLKSKFSILTTSWRRRAKIFVANNSQGQT